MENKSDSSIEEIKKMNLYEKLINITNDIKSVAKNLEVGVGKNSYKAVGEADVLKAVKELEFKYRVYSYPSKRTIVDRSILEIEKEYQGNITRSNQIFMRIEVEYTFVNIDKTEETITITTYGDGVDSNDKGPGKAMTYADKYALLKAYKIVTGEDPDQNPSPDKTTIGKKTNNVKSGQINSSDPSVEVDYKVELEKYISEKKLDKKAICIKYKLNASSKQEEFKNALLNLKVEVGE